MSLFEDLKGKFETKYGVTIDFDAMRKAYLTNTGLNALIANKKESNPDAAFYKHCLMTLLHKHLENGIEFREKSIGGYGFIHLNLLDFVNEYEGMMKARHNEDPEKKDQKRHSYEGLRKTLFDEVKAETEIYNKPISAIWGEKIVENQMTVDELKEKVEREHNYYVENHKNVENALIAQHVVVNVIAAKKALEKAWKDRGVFWRLRHPIQAIQQYTYMNSLKERITTYAQDGWKTENYDLTSSMMEEVYQKVDLAIQAKQEQLARQNVQVDEEQPVQETKTLIVKNSIQKLFGMDKARTDNLADEIVKKLPGNVKQYPGHLSMVLRNGLQLCLESIYSDSRFIDVLELPAEEQMVHVVRAISEAAVSYTKGLGYNEMEKLVADQIIVDAIVYEIPIVKENPELFCKFSKGFMVNYPKEYVDKNAFVTNQEYEKKIQTLTETKAMYDEYMKNLEIQQIEVDVNEEANEIQSEFIEDEVKDSEIEMDKANLLE